MFWVPNITTILVAWIVQSIILFGYIWFEKLRKPEESYDCWLILGLRGFIFIVFFVLALMFIDSNVKVFLGVIGYSNIFLHLSSIILTFILSAEIIIGVILVAPNRKGVITFGTVLGSFIYYWQFYLNQVDLNEIDVFGSKYSALGVGLLLPITVGFITVIILVVIELIYNKFKPDNRYTDEPFWNIQIKVKSFIDFKFNLILYLLITVELILNLQGMSLTFWISYII
ncbi:MAG: hypothetical protein ACTSR8_11595 [Promethearchaeota archaeon]